MGLQPPRSPDRGGLAARGAALCAILGLVTACGSVQRSLLFQKSITLPAGRFVGPIEIEVPRRADRKNRDFEIHAGMRASCDPRLRVSFPDGEVASIGEDDEPWQELLARRASAGAAADQAPGAPPLQPGQIPGAPQGPGHWQAVRTETWPGQLTFMRERQQRCSLIDRYELTYLNAFDESGRITFWAETPQEIGVAEISIKIYELVDIEAEAEAEARAASKARASAQISTHASAEVGVKVSAGVIPPKPGPKRESPPPAKSPGATWVPGEWVYNPGEGRWVWWPGSWARPAQTPAPKFEDTSNPPNVGCTWSPGRWTWEPGVGQWTWIPGHWRAPPPLVETPGAPPVPESSWVAGYWIKVNVGFKWVAGYWGKPKPRAEVRPPPPYAGARWVEGAWVSVKGSWVWSPGFYERSGRPPPPPRAETPPPPPTPDSIWLAGFWRWNEARNDYDWIGGHWERPPGEGYVWVPDPVSPGIGMPIGGHWELRVKVNAGGAIKVQP